MSSPIAPRQYFEALLRAYGPQRWWPAESPFEVMVGAVLTQNTSWKNVEAAVGNLKTFGLLSPEKIHELDEETLQEAIRPAGFFRQKAKRLKDLVAWFVERYGGEFERLRDVPTERLREELLAIPGIGMETADSILLYALDRPVFVIDKYTWRVLSRHHLVPEETTYEEMQDFLQSRLPKDASLYNEYHALFVAVGKRHCGTTPRCEGCPLEPFLPAR